MRLGHSHLDLLLPRAIVMPSMVGTPAPSVIASDDHDHQPEKERLVEARRLALQAVDAAAADRNATTAQDPEDDPPPP